MNRAEPIPYVEFWKSKQEWLAADNATKRELFDQVRALVVRYARGMELTCGPYLHTNGTTSNLIWSIDARHAQESKQHYPPLLPEYFEPVMSGSASGLTAKDYYNALSQKH